MKYLKTYESSQKRFWKLPCSSMKIFLIAFSKLEDIVGLEDNYFHSEYGYHNIKKTTKYDYIYIGHDPIEYRYTFEKANKSYLKYKYNYEGEIIVTPTDIEEWEVKQNAKKYNL